MKLFMFDEYKIKEILKKERFLDFNGRCGECGWDATRFYILASSYEEAVKTFKQILAEGSSPLCADCMCLLLYRKGYEVTEKGGK